jgi:hypothetical protein
MKVSSVNCSGSSAAAEAEAAGVSAATEVGAALVAAAAEVAAAEVAAAEVAAAAEVLLAAADEAGAGAALPEPPQVATSPPGALYDEASKPL